jgi:hypothetical protein
MAQTTTNKLRAQSIAKLGIGMHSDGAGLYLHVTEKQRSWTFIYVRAGKRRQMGLGGADDVTLAVARQKAADARELLSQGLDPLEIKRQGKPRADGWTFADAADEYLAEHEQSWKREKDRKTWRRCVSRERDKDGNILRTGYCLPIVDRAIESIDADDVLACIQPHWHDKQPTMRAVRSHIEAIIDFAVGRKKRPAGVNPAAWANFKSAKLLGKIDYSQRPHEALP